MVDEGGGLALDGVGAGFLLPFAAGEIVGDLLLIETGEADDGSDGAAGLLAVRRPDGNAGEDAVAAAGEQTQVFFGLFERGGFWQDARSGCDHRVGGDDEGVAVDRRQFFNRQTQRMGAWGFLSEGGLFDIRGDDLVRLDPDLPQEFQPPGAGGTKNYLNRNVIRPLERS